MSPCRASQFLTDWHHTINMEQVLEEPPHGKSKAVFVRLDTMKSKGQLLLLYLHCNELEYRHCNKLPYVQSMKDLIKIPQQLQGHTDIQRRSLTVDTWGTAVWSWHKHCTHTLHIDVLIYSLCVPSSSFKMHVRDFLQCETHFLTYLDCLLKKQHVKQKDGHDSQIRSLERDLLLICFLIACFSERWSCTEEHISDVDAWNTSPLPRPLVVCDWDKQHCEIKNCWGLKHLADYFTVWWLHILSIFVHIITLIAYMFLKIQTLDHTFPTMQLDSILTRPSS